MKKLLSVLMAMTMLLSLLALPSNAATVTENNTFSGIPTAADKTYKDGNFQVDIVAGDGVTFSDVGDTLKIVNNEDEKNVIKVQMKYPCDKKVSDLRFTFKFKFVGNDNGSAEQIFPNGFSMNVYKKDSETLLFPKASLIWSVDDGKWRNVWR